MNPDQRPTRNERYVILVLWIRSSSEEINSAFVNADKEIQNIPYTVYISRGFTFSNLLKPVNSSFITSYLQEEENNQGNICLSLISFCCIIQ